MGMLNRTVLVLNQNYEPLTITKAKRAIILVYLGKAEVVEKYDGQRIHSISTNLPLPSIVRLVFFIKAPRKMITLSRKNIVKRDGHQCQYCGKTEGPLTTDHIIPKTRGGADSWENLVCACSDCNKKKGHRTLKEAGMKLVKKPKRPQFFAFIHAFVDIPDLRWRQYLFLEP